MAQDTGTERHSDSVRTRRDTLDTGTLDTGSAPRRGRITGRPLERREVRVDDPALSPETNARLTEELREAVGATSVAVPRDRPRATRGEPMSDRSVITMRRIMYAMSLGIALVIGTVVALTTGSWWWLPLAAAVHAAGTVVVATVAVRITRGIEHPSPTLAAAMNEEGVVSADHRFSEMVEEFKAPEADELGEWANVRSVRPQDDPATASFQQSRSTVASSQPSTSVPDPRTVDLFIGALALFFGVVSVIIPVVVAGRWLWLTPAIVVPLSAALVAVNTVTRARDGLAGWWTSRAGILAVCGATILAVAVFCALVALFVA